MLAFEILRAMESYGTRTIFGTHFHNIISMITQAKAGGACSGFDFLCAGISEGKRRTYRITRSTPEGRSYAAEIADKYGLSYDKLIQNGKR